ncbi:MAG: hypothetical protein F4W92_00275 [Gammaproteobacteria bacterium]|nr:hypothetical protein [Gammaproteobacteria bacterium]
MSVFLGFSFFRFHRRRTKILAIYESFLTSSKRRLHPLEIGRQSGMHTLDVMKVLSSTPEIFLRVPGSGSKGIDLYALRPSIVVQNSDEVLAYVNRLARRDRILYYSLIVLVLAVIVVAGLRSIAFVRFWFE